MKYACIICNTQFTPHPVHRRKSYSCHNSLSLSLSPKQSHFEKPPRVRGDLPASGNYILHIGGRLGLLKLAYELHDCFRFVVLRRHIIVERAEKSDRDNKKTLSSEEEKTPTSPPDNDNAAAKVLMNTLFLCLFLLRCSVGFHPRQVVSCIIKAVDLGADRH